jgi:hypothetical protein
MSRPPSASPRVLSPHPNAPVPRLVSELEGALRDLLAEAPEHRPPRDRRPGRPPVLPAALLWLAFLLCVLRGFTSQRGVWRLLALYGLWGEPPLEITEQAVYERLEHAPVSALQGLFTRLTTLLLAREGPAGEVPFAPFATDILALDHCVLDKTARKLKFLRGVSPGDPALVPGRLATLFDVRRQLYRRVEWEEDARRNVKVGVHALLDGLAPGTLLLFDLGYYAFPWFDQLAERGLWYVSRQRDKISVKTLQVLYEGRPDGPDTPLLRDRIVYLGKHRSDKAAHPVRLIEVEVGSRTHAYLTNVLEPRLLPASDVVRLYARRWDIEQSFNLLKTHLGLYLLWSGRSNVVGLQAYACLILAQVVLAFRNELAERTGAELREISLPLMLEAVSHLAREGKDPIEELVRRGRRAKIIRPFRGKEYVIPEPPWEEYAEPERPPPRAPRYAGKVGKPSGTTPRARKQPRQRTEGWGQRKRRSSTR